MVIQLVAALHRLHHTHWVVQALSYSEARAGTSVFVKWSAPEDNVQLHQIKKKVFIKWFEGVFSKLVSNFLSDISNSFQIFFISVFCIIRVKSLPSACIPFDVTHLLSNRCEFRSVFRVKEALIIREHNALQMSFVTTVVRRLQRVE